MKNQGYVYLLINPTMDGLVKIGKTNRDPSVRVRELSAATGVPTPFLLAFDAYFENCTAAEEYIHTLLRQRGYRIAEGKEFFRVPVNEAIKVIIEAQRYFESFESSLTKKKPITAGNTGSTSSDKAIQALLSEAQANLDGIGDVLRNPKRALELYKQASKLGSAQAFLRMGQIYMKDMVKIGCWFTELGKAPECFEEAGNRGAGEGWAMLAAIENDNDNAQKAWGKYCRSSHRGTTSEQCDYCINYLSIAKERNLQFQANPVPRAIRDVLVIELAERVEAMEKKKWWSNDLTKWSNYKILRIEIEQGVFDHINGKSGLRLAPWLKWEYYCAGVKATFRGRQGMHLHEVSVTEASQPPFIAFTMDAENKSICYEIKADSYIKALQQFLEHAVRVAIRTGESLEAIISSKHF